MDLREEVRKLLQKIGPGQMMNTAYDTAWIARLGEIGEPIGELALEWLRENQLPDGSWGAKEPLYYHDRVICTLAAMNALARRGRVQDRKRLRRAEDVLEKYVKNLQLDPAGETVGFELITPTLLQEAKVLGAIRYQENEVLRNLIPYRAAKLAILPTGMVNRHVTVAFSSEMAGQDGQHLLEIENLQEANGSVAHSPSATAYFARYVHPAPNALEYLRRVAPTGAAPNVAPFDVFEQAWTLWNLSLAVNLDDNLKSLYEPRLDFLENSWIPGQGIGFAAEYTPKDGDDTGLVFEVLKRLGRKVDIEAVESYEHVYYYRCYSLESTPSISANIHILGALREAGYEIKHPSVQKILRFLQKTRIEDMYWFDKWHASPYYATNQAVVACSGYADSILENAIEWIIQTQKKDGAWGYYLSTAEETAYCLQALSICKLNGKSIPIEILKRGKDWLMRKVHTSHPPLWIGKCLYCPELVVKSAIFSAFLLTSQV